MIRISLRIRGLKLGSSHSWQRSWRSFHPTRSSQASKLNQWMHRDRGKSLNEDQLARAKPKAAVSNQGSDHEHSRTMEDSNHHYHRESYLRDITRRRYVPQSKPHLPFPQWSRTLLLWTHLPEFHPHMRVWSTHPIHWVSPMIYVRIWPVI